jgi:GT2 family glycosyltransferase
MRSNKDIKKAFIRCFLDRTVQILQEEGIMGQTLVIILNWNNSQLTINLAESIVQIERRESPIVLIVDNNSKENEKKILRDFVQKKGFDEITEKQTDSYRVIGHTVLFLDDNYGYAKGNNFGLKLAATNGYRFVLISNNDIELREPVLGKLIKTLDASEKYALVGPKIIDRYGTQEGPFKRPGMFYQFWYLLFYPILLPISKILGISIKTNTRYPYRLPGSFLLFKTNRISDIGFFDENTFLYAEELIIAEKFRKLGYETVFDPEVSVTHYHEASTKKIDRKKRFEYHLRSDLYYFSEYRNYSKTKLALMKFARKAYFYLWEPLYLVLHDFISRRRKNERDHTRGRKRDKTLSTD